MLTKYHKQVIEEMFEEMVNLDVNSEEYKELYNEMIEYLKKEDFDKITDEDIIRYTKYLREVYNEGIDIEGLEENLYYWEDYLEEMENNGDYKNPDYAVAHTQIAKIKMLMNKFEDILEN